MNSSLIVGVVFAITVGASLLGAIVRAHLPEHHLSADSRDVMKLVMGLVATMAALVLGLLISSSKAFYDTQTAEVQAVSVKVVSLDAVLEAYGLETAPVREAVRRSTERGYQRIWTDNVSPTDQISPAEASAIGSVIRMVRDLSPHTDSQRALREDAIGIASALGEARLLMLEQLDTSLNWPLLVILVFWIGVLFLGFGLFARLNATVMTTLVVGALSAASAIFLILELSMPYSGLVRVSPAPLLAALAQIGR